MVVVLKSAAHLTGPRDDADQAVETAPALLPTGLFAGFRP
ncbi:hypothetical protein NSU_2299 [Novosphingobium pentaromativorans US6-1]|uniref:Uncharacterized protein n=1 Tax=Novosphingobium pentaromativorans US6-1 TaxID=1088721 RepID=G6ED78_9SPHN|nr:hypothetical protein NSU_2299 [Novosphingobium pentaromativorans US6-1]